MPVKQVSKSCEVNLPGDVNYVVKVFDNENIKIKIVKNQGIDKMTLLRYGNKYKNSVSSPLNYARSHIVSIENEIALEADLLTLVNINDGDQKLRFLFAKRINKRFPDN